MKVYKVVYKFQDEILVEAESAEEAVSLAEQIEWENPLWFETWTGHYVEFTAETVIDNVLSDMGLHKEGEGDV